MCVSHLMLEEAILQGFVSWVAASAFKQQLILLYAGTHIRHQATGKQSTLCASRNFCMLLQHFTSISS